MKSSKKSIENRRNYWMGKCYGKFVSKETRVKLLIQWLWKEADFANDGLKATPLVPEIKELLLKELPPESRRLQTLRENGIL